mmetsp:Transcript_39996/g.78860  ORF Transcript_39996/g.78860 Transcript_39996/m.78860 type:complete len:97 (-) Transcript_39996:536-826(-)
MKTKGKDSWVQWTKRDGKRDGLREVSDEKGGRTRRELEGRETHPVALTEARFFFCINRSRGRDGRREENQCRRKTDGFPLTFCLPALLLYLYVSSF